MKRVIIIDDNPVTNKMFIEPLRGKYDVDVVMYLKSVDRMLSRNHYSLIVLDVMMPTQGFDTEDNMSVGYFYYKKFLKPHYPRVKVLFWSRLNEESRRSFDPSLANETMFLQKTTDRNHLLHKVSEILD